MKFAFIFLLLTVQAFAAPKKKSEEPREAGTENAGAFDPSKNVLQLVEAAIQRLDDLREAQEKFETTIRDVEHQRLDDLRAAESRRIDEQLAMRTFYEEKLQVRESSRINDIRAVDVGNVAIANDRAMQQASVLADQVTKSADALRALVATTAATMADSTRSITTQFDGRLMALEKGYNQTSGRAGLADQQLSDLIAEMRTYGRAQASGTGKSEGATALWGYLVGGIAVVVALGTYMKNGKDRQELERRRNGTPA